jgi:hypothetical protein
MKIKSITNLGLLSLSLLLLMNLFFNACKKDTIQVNTIIPVEVPKLTGVVFDNGRLKFNSQLDFENATATMRLHLRNLSSFEKQFEGFVSSRSAYFKSAKDADNLMVDNLPEYMTVIKMHDGETYVRPSVDFQLIGHLTNQQGLLQIGSSVLKYTYSDVFKTDEANVDLLTQTYGLKDNASVKVLPISRLGQEITTERAELIECEWFYTSSGSKKFHAEIKSRIYPGYSQLSVDFDHYKKFLGVWYLNDAPMMSFSGTVRANCCTTSNGAATCCSTVGSNSCTLLTGTCRYATSASGSNEGEIFDVILENNSGSHFSIGNPTNVVFTGKGDNNVTTTCTTML